MSAPALVPFSTHQPAAATLAAKQNALGFAARLSPSSTSAPRADPSLPPMMDNNNNNNNNTEWATPWVCRPSPSTTQEEEDSESGDDDQLGNQPPTGVRRLPSQSDALLLDMMDGHRSPVQDWLQLLEAEPAGGDDVGSAEADSFESGGAEVGVDFLFVDEDEGYTVVTEALVRNVSASTSR